MADAIAVAEPMFFVNYVFYEAGAVIAVLLAIDLPNPSTYSAEGERVVYTFVGVAIAVVVMLLGTLLVKRASQPQPGQQPGAQEHPASG